MATMISFLNVIDLFYIFFIFVEEGGGNSQAAITKS